MADVAARNDSDRNDYRNAFDVTPRRLGWFLITFYVVWALLAGLLSYARVATAESPTLAWPEIAIITIIAAAITVGIALPLAFGFVEGIPMVLANIIKQRHREEGRKEGREETQLVWEAWNERRESAERAGEPFTEPPPSRSGTSGENGR